MIGNPNVGKTALLNALTSGSFIVGNYPGTTVEVKSGNLEIDGKVIEIVDLPGIFSLKAYSDDERVVVEYLKNKKPDVLINVINAVTLERGLYLTLKLLNFRIPIIIVLNMVDEASKRGIEINSEKLEQILGVPVVKTVAVTKEGIEKLKQEILKGGRIGKIRVSGDEFEIVKKAEEIGKEVVIRHAMRYGASLDDAFTDKYLSIPIFFSIMWMVFRFTYDVATPLVSLIDLLFSSLADSVSSMDGILFSMLGGGVITGLGSVLVFLPNIMFLFIAISILELSGYLPRAVFALDRIMVRFGLVGRSVIPMILGFGCSVPAVMSTRSIEDKIAKKITILITPFISCSARLPIYVLLTAVFFRGIESIVIMVLYVMGIGIALFSALIFRKFIFGGQPEYILELPPFRFPRFSDVWILTWSRTKHFLKKAGTIILAMSVVIWYITNFPGGKISKSYAGVIGKAIAPIFSPLGWGWEVTLAVLMGFVAKEVVVETLGIVLGDAERISLLLTPAQAFGFMVFTLLYVPCMATIATIKAESGWKYAVFSAIYTTTIAYIMAFITLKLLEVIT